MKKEELRRIREAEVPVLLINGRYDNVAGLMFVRRLAKALNGQLLETGMFHFDIDT
jgi:pimeloyl-ACP methyl ester carboxylesterase